MPTPNPAYPRLLHSRRKCLPLCMQRSNAHKDATLLFRGTKTGPRFVSARVQASRLDEDSELKRLRRTGELIATSPRTGAPTKLLKRKKFCAPCRKGRRASGYFLRAFRLSDVSRVCVGAVDRAIFDSINMVGCCTCICVSVRVEFIGGGRSTVHGAQAAGGAFCQQETRNPP